MGRLTAARRRALKPSQFAGPGESYPVDTKARARAAKSRASEAANAGRMSQREEALIDAKADRVLGDYHGPGKTGHNAKARTGKTRSWTGR